MPKIIFSIYDDLKNPYYGGGGARAVWEIARRLPQDWEITVITGKYPQSKDEARGRVKYKRIGLNFLGPKLGQLFFSFLLPFYVLTQKFDIWVESFTPPFSAGFLPLFTKKPVIGLVHMLSGREMQRKYFLPFPAMEKIALKLYRNFIVVSEPAKKEILKANPAAKVAVIPNGAGFTGRAGEGPKQYVAFLGRIEVWQKGLDLLLEAYKKISGQIGSQLLIAGSGIKSEEQKLKEIIKNLGLQGKVVLAGRAQGKLKSEIFRKSWMMVVPSRFETFGLSALEALSFGVPLITFDIEGFKWIPGESVIKVKPFDVSGLAQSIIMLEKDKNLRDKLAAGGLKAARRYTWENASENYIKYFKLLINSAPKTYA
ncbi:MAG: glycosyltransferase family 4 protein [Patescibacteria group bacterium]|nr:glycosyltransferase family 4 protein [Patescibacteria group bacterium]